MNVFAFDENDNTIIKNYYENESYDIGNPACPKSVVIPKKITSILREAFKSKSLTSAILSPNVITIEDFAFQDNSLTSVTIPDSVTTVGQGVFVYNDLTSGPVATNVVIEDHIWKTTENNCFELNLTEVENYHANEGGDVNNPVCPRNIVIPQEITAIRTGAFDGKSLISVTIPDSVTAMGSNAFHDNSLTSIVIPEGVTSIEPSTFADNSLTSVFLPESLTSIGNDGFLG